jgi:hypothetical protein
VKPATLTVPQPGYVDDVVVAALDVVGVEVVRTHPGIGLQAGSREPYGRTQTWQALVTVLGGGIVAELVLELLVIVLWLLLLELLLLLLLVDVTEP